MPAYQRIIQDALADLLDGVTDATKIERGFSRRPGLQELPLITLYVTGSRAKNEDHAGTAIHRTAHLFVEYVAKGEDAEDRVHVALDQIEQAILDNPTINGAVRCAEFDEDSVELLDQDMRVCGGIIEYHCYLETHCQEFPPALHLPQDIPEGVDMADLQLTMDGEIRFEHENIHPVEPGGVDLNYHMRDPRPGSRKDRT